MSARTLETPGSSDLHMVSQAVSFFIHLAISLAVWALTVVAITLVLHPESVPPAITLALAFCTPLLAAFIVMKIRPSSAAPLTWFAGVIWFCVWGLYVLDLPTGPSACYHCGAVAKLYLTFFSLNQDSGLLDGQGRFLGTWPAVAMIGYAAGAKLGLLGIDMPLEAS